VVIQPLENTIEPKQFLTLLRAISDIRKPGQSFSQLLHAMLVSEKEASIIGLGLIQPGCPKFLKPRKPLVMELLGMREIVGIVEQSHLSLAGVRRPDISSPPHCIK
jgi:hypothetical protein